MNYHIENVDPTAPKYKEQINRLLINVFDLQADLEHTTFELHTETGQQKSIHLAAIENDQIIGFNAFIHHEFYVEGKSISGYQSCWSAINERYRGKKIFQNLIQEAKKILAQNNAYFLFGYPSPPSYPIFTQKLGPKEYNSFKLQIPNFEFIIKSYLSKSNQTIENLESKSVLQNNQELFHWKKKKHGDLLRKFEYGNSYIWGVIRTRRVKYWPFAIKYFDIGGIELKNTADIYPLFRQITRLRGVYYIQSVVPDCNRYNELFSGFRQANTENFAVFNLKEGLDWNFNLFAGLKDVF
jgi:carbonic anhydrase/acetyltransferase-like protein (isoleucine patch superfamily)